MQDQETNKEIIPVYECHEIKSFSEFQFDNKEMIRVNIDIKTETIIVHITCFENKQVF